jgi:hypothetical protein
MYKQNIYNITETHGHVKTNAKYCIEMFQQQGLGREWIPWNDLRN